MPPRVKRVFSTPFAAILSLSLLLLDQTLKSISPIIWFHYRSTGWLVLLIVLLLTVIYSGRQLKQLASPLPLLLIVAGSVSNMIDLIRFGRVVDYWPWADNSNRYYFTTNIADLIIWLGIGWILLELIGRTIWRRQQ